MTNATGCRGLPHLPQKLQPSAARSAGTVVARRPVFTLLFCAAASFLAQPIGYRPAGIPIALTLMGIFTLFYFASEARTSREQTALALAFPAFLVLSDLLIGFDVRGSILAVLMMFAFFASSLRISETQLKVLWRTTAWVCLLLAALGTYRYISGYVAPLSQNTGGIYEVQQSYFYLGISYLPSTRNSDAFYFILGLLAAMRLALSEMKRSKIVLYSAIASFQGLVIALTLSRGAYFAAVFGVLVLVPRRHWPAVIFSAAILLPIAFVASAPLLGSLDDQISMISSLIYNAIISIFDPNAASNSLGFRHNYSNSARFEIYYESFMKFLEYPFGQGVDNIIIGTPNPYTIRLHSENLFLDFMVAFGVFALIPFAFVGRRLLKGYRLRRTSINARLGFAILGACLIFALFNSPINEAIFWFAIGLGLVEVNRADVLRRQCLLTRVEPFR